MESLNAYLMSFGTFTENLSVFVQCGCLCPVFAVSTVSALLCVSLRVFARLCVSLRVFACLCVSLRVFVCLCVSLRVFVCLCAIWVSL